MSEKGNKLFCGACGGALSEVERYRHGLPGDHMASARYDILLCAKCGSGQTFPMPSDAELSDLYASYGARAPNAGCEPRDILVRLRRWYGVASASVFFDATSHWCRPLRRFMSSFLVPRATLLPLRTDVLKNRCKCRPIRLLDVGCGSCEFLEFARSSSVDCVGTEVTEDAVTRGRNLGLDLRVGNVHDFGEAETFDLIRFCHVLEHVRDPFSDLVKAHRLLGAGGYLMVAVPQIPAAVTSMGMSTCYHLPFHLHHFSRRGLKILLERSGFRIVAKKTKSNSLLIHTLSHHVGAPPLANNLGLRMACIACEMLFDAVGWGDSVEVHAVAI